MVYYCVAYGCKNRWTPGKKGNISFHQFPAKKPDLCKKWVLALKRRDFVPSNRSVICSDHFESSCFIQSGWSSKKVLNPNAVPSIFNFLPQPDIKKLGGENSKNIRKRKQLVSDDEMTVVDQEIANHSATEPTSPSSVIILEDSISLNSAEIDPMSSEEIYDDSCPIDDKIREQTAAEAEVHAAEEKNNESARDETAPNVSTTTPDLLPSVSINPVTLERRYHLYPIDDEIVYVYFWVMVA